jgi:riboflavin synthase
VFTGIIESVGVVTEVRREGDLAHLAIEAPDRVCFDAVRETLERTSLGAKCQGSRVNLERAMRADGRLDGHIVQGHVDGTGRVERLERDGDDVRLFITCDAEISGSLVEKGSVTVDGVSLTVVSVGDAGFDVALIPHTLAVTTLGDRRPGDLVNVEADVLGKYVKRYLERVLPQGVGNAR